MEHDAEEIWEAVAATLARVAGELDGPGRAIGITNQRETIVVWDRRHRDGPCTGPSCGRTGGRRARCEELEPPGHLDLVRDRTGLVLDPYFSATKLEWLLAEGGVDRSPDLAFGTVDSWLLWRLTGGAVHATDPTNACRTLLFDIRAQRWDRRAGRTVRRAPVEPSRGAPVEWPARRHAPSASVCSLAGVPISGVAGDQAALFGQACFAPGMTKNTYGTGSFVLMNVGDRCPAPVDGLLTSVAWVLERPATVAYALEGAIFITGAAISWLRDGSASSARRPRSGRLAESVDDTDGVYLVPGLHRTRQPVVGPLRPRHPGRGDPRGRPGPPGPGRGGGHGLPDPRRRRRHVGGRATTS